MSHPGSAFGMPPSMAGAVDLANYAARSSATPGADDMTKGIDVLDSEINEIHKVMVRLRERATVPRNYEHFQQEVKERFHDIGFVVDVVWYETDVADVKMPEIVIKGRVERKAFDRDQMVHEVTNDVLGLGEGGIIQTDKGKVAAMMDGSYQGQMNGVHKH